MVSILGACRTPSGSFLGGLSSLEATRLGSLAIEGALCRAEIDRDCVDEVIAGLVVSSACGQAPARQAALGAGLPESVPCTGVSKVCGSGMQAIIMGAQSIGAGDNRIVVACGMESMSRAPHLIRNLRKGIKYADASLEDALICDGLRDAYTGKSMGLCAEECVKKYGFSREEQDAFATESFRRAQRATEEGIFKGEIVPVRIKGKGGEGKIDRDEGPSKVQFEKIPHLRPAFKKDGTITAANASTLNDGAACVVLGDREEGPFRIVAYASHAGSPEWFTTAPIESMKKCLAKTSLSLEDIDLFEINEAFAVVVLAAIRDLDLPRDRVNIYGGAISLGHAIGCSGARIVVTLMTAMNNRKARYGMASLCIGGGEGLSLIIERMGK